MSRICQRRPRSRYSKPWIPNQRPRPPSQPWTPANSPSSAAEDDEHQRSEEYVGEHALAAAARGRAIIGTRKIPAARNEEETKKIASCTCKVRTRLYGKTSGEVEAEEVAEVGAIVLRGGADERLDKEEGGHHQEEPGGARAGPA